MSLLSNVFARDSKSKGESSPPPATNSQTHKIDTPPAIKRHLGEVDQYKGFLGGQRRPDLQRGRVMAQYINDWERKWERTTGQGNSHGNFFLNQRQG